MVETTTAVLDCLFQKNTISLAGQSHKDGNKNMSYHVQQNTQQQSLGIFIVVAFHVLLIWALANGLGQAIICSITTSGPVKVTTIEKKITPTIVEPTIPVIQTTTKINIDPNLPVINIESSNQPQVIETGGGDPITQVGPSISKPKLMKATKPDYPATASRLGEEGETGLRLYITENGRVADVQLYASSGSSRLDEAAIKHAKRNWTFSPCTEGGKAIACWHQTKLVWRLEDAAR